LVTLPVRRGAVGPLAMRFLDGFVYGMDFKGIWRWSPGGQLAEIGAPLASDWRSGRLDWTYRDNWHIGFDATRRLALFFVSEGTDLYPRKAYCWHLDAERWVGTEEFDAGVTAGCEYPDGNGALRYIFASTNTARDRADLWMDGMGHGAGVNPLNVSNVSGTATGGSGSTLQCTGAGWPTAGQGLKGCAVRKIKTATGAVETKLISANTASELTTETWTDAPVAGDTFNIGPISAVYRTGRLSLGLPDRKKQFVEVWIWARYDANAVPFMVRAYFDGATAASTDIVLADADDGVTRAIAAKDAVVTPATADVHRFRVPLKEVWAQDVPVEVWSVAAGMPWDILGIKLVCRVDDSQRPRDK
jgi:hypothetical protein